MRTAPAPVAVAQSVMTLRNYVAVRAVLYRLVPSGWISLPGRDGIDGGNPVRQRFVATTSRYSLGTTVEPSPEMLKRPISWMMSRDSVVLPALSRASNAFSIGP